MYLEALGSGRTWWSRAASARGGDKGTFGRLRSALSRVSTRAAMLLFPTRLWHVSDPMSGCFLVRREVLDLDRLRPQGFKILLEILVRTPGLGVSEVPFGFGERHAGETKASVREALRYVGQLGRLELGQLTARFGRFTRRGRHRPGREHVAAGAVRGRGGHLLRRRRDPRDPGLDPVELLPHRGWVFAGREHERSRGRRAAMFFAMNNAALALRVPLLFVLTSGLGMNYLVSNVLSLVALTVIRFGVADVLDLGQGAAPRGRRRSATTSTASSRSPPRSGCPSCSGFLVPEALGRPTIRVRIGHMRSRAEYATARGSTTATAAAPSTGTATRRNGNGTRRRARVPERNGTSPNSRRAGARQARAQHQVHRRPRGLRLRRRDLPGGRAHRGACRAAAAALAARALHQRGRADPALDIREQGLRARARRLLRGRGPGVHGHGPHGHGQDDHHAQAARPLPVFVPLGRPHDRVPGRPRAGVSEAADDQPAHRRTPSRRRCCPGASGSS